MENKFLKEKQFKREYSFILDEKTTKKRERLQFDRRIVVAIVILIFVLPLMV